MNDQTAMAAEISVVVPVWNERETVPSLLRSLQTQSLRPREIVCVDGGSTDGTPEVVRGRHWGPVPVRLIEAGPSFPGRGRNVGTKEAHTDWIAYIDAGVEADPHWLAELAAKVRQSPETDVVFGNFSPRLDSPFTECAACAYVKPASSDDPPYRGPVVPSTLLRRSAWHDVGGFEEHLRSGEDLLFLDALKRSVRVAFAPRAHVSWELAPDWRSTFCRFRAYSASGIEAGTFRDWHLRMLGRYTVLFLSTLSAIPLGWRGLLVPFALLVCFLCIRASLSVWRYRRELPRFLARLPFRILGTAGVLAAVDAGLLLGTLDWALRRAKSIGPGSTVPDRASPAPPRS